MSDLFDSLKKNKEKTTGKKRNVRELSPVKFPFSDDEDSDDMVLKKPIKSPGGRNAKTKISPKTQRILALMKKCVVKLPKDKDGRLLQKIHAAWKKQRRDNKKSNKYPIVKIRKSLPVSPKQAKKPEPARKSVNKTPESVKKSVNKTPEAAKKSTPAKVYVKFPLSTPNSNRKKKSYAKTPMKKNLKSKPRGYDIAIKRLNATPALVREFGKRFFMCYVDIENKSLVQLLKNPKVKSSPAKKKKLNSSVRFNETVEVFGSSGSEGEEDAEQDPMPVSLITANGSFGGTSTPSPKPKGNKKTAVLEKKKPILTPAAKKNYRLADEKKADISNEVEDEEDDDAEYIVPTEISPPKKQATPPRQSLEKTPSPEKENTSLSSEPAAPEPPILDSVVEPVIEAPEPMVEDTPEEENEKEVENVEGEEKQPRPAAVEQEEPAEEEPKNNSHGNDFENDEDSQGQNIVQDFISRTVQDLSHDDSEDIQDDEELVDDKRNSSPSVINDGDNDSVSNKISRMYNVLKDKVLGGPAEDEEAMETDNNA